MRRAVALLVLLAAGHGRAEAPIDLETPFVKTALIQERYGSITEVAVLQGQRNGEVMEFRKVEGGLLVVPRQQVLAVLPCLPAGGSNHLRSDAQRALKVLQEARARFPQRPEVSAEAIAAWQALAASTTGQDQVQSAALEAWREKIQRLSSQTDAEELKRLGEEGAGFLGKFPERAGEIRAGLQSLKELAAIDLKQADAFRLEIGAWGENSLPGLLLWALLLVPLVVALQAFSTAVRAFREGVPLAGLLRLVLAGLALAFFAALVLAGAEGETPLPGQDKGPSVAARKAVWFSLNQREKWAEQTAQKITLPASDWTAFLAERLAVGAGSESFPFWHLGKPAILRLDSVLVFRQPVQAHGIRLSFRFLFALPPPGRSLTDLELTGAFLGKIPLGATLGQLVWGWFQPSYEAAAETCGIRQGVRWLAGEGDKVVIEIPAVKKPAPQAKESLSARELAEAFDQGYGEMYFGKVITVEGALIEVSSFRETLGTNTKLGKQVPMDEFSLEGIPEGPGRRVAIRVRCQFKSPDAYFLDAKGDLFKSWPAAQNPSSDLPILRRRDGVTRVRISSGRVESKGNEAGLITLYDCRKVEGHDGNGWISIWSP